MPRIYTESQQLNQQYEQALGMLILSRKAVHYYSQIEGKGPNAVSGQAPYREHLRKRVGLCLDRVVGLMNIKGEKSSLLSKICGQSDAGTAMPRSLYTSQSKVTNARYGNNRNQTGSRRNTSNNTNQDDNHNYGPQVNTNGLPMAGNSGIDITGHTYGDTGGSWGGGFND